MFNVSMTINTQVSLAETSIKLCCPLKDLIPFLLVKHLLPSAPPLLPFLRQFSDVLLLVKRPLFL